jgi:predicted RNA-binding Zn ribbon-like protein
LTTGPTLRDFSRQNDPANVSPDTNTSDERDNFSRTQQAKEAVEEYIRDLRELIKKLHRKMN